MHWQASHSFTCISCIMNSDVTPFKAGLLCSAGKHGACRCCQGCKQLSRAQDPKACPAEITRANDSNFDLQHQHRHSCGAYEARCPLPAAGGPRITWATLCHELGLDHDDRPSAGECGASSTCNGGGHPSAATCSPVLAFASTARTSMYGVCNHMQEA